MKPFEYLEAKTIEGACSLLSKYKGRARVVAGGTDLFVLMKAREITPEYVINLKTISNLGYINYANGEGLKIGTLATLRDIERSPIIREKFSVIAGAIKQMATPAIRNMGTIGGNLCNASPSADTAPPLMGLGAKLKIVGVKGERKVALEEFFLGAGEVALKADEILAEIQIPDVLAYTRGIYLKLKPRTAIGIALVSVAVIITLDSKQVNIADAKIVLGAVAPTPIRARKAEEIIRGKAIEERLIEKAAQVASEEASPRSRADYRREMVKVLTKQAIRQVTAAV